MNEAIENTAGQEAPGFEITDDKLAEWAVRKIREAQEDTAKWQAHFAAQLAAIKKANDDTIAFMTGALGRFFITVPHHETKTQAKYELPSATLIRKQQRPQYERDDDALLAYLDSNSRADLIRIKREPAWDEIKKSSVAQGETLVDADTGEVVGGVRVIARPDVFDVKLKGE